MSQPMEEKISEQLSEGPGNGGYLSQRKEEQKENLTRNPWK